MAENTTRFPIFTFHKVRVFNKSYALYKTPDRVESRVLIVFVFLGHFFQTFFVDLPIKRGLFTCTGTQV